MAQINLDIVASYLQEVANDKIVPRFQSLRDDEIHAKTSPSDLVTIADLEAEIELTRILTDYLPGSLVVGEEAVSKEEVDPAILSNEDGYIWVVDPVDGTNNFAHGKERFGSMIALVKDNATVASWILDVPQNRIAMAEKGAGVEVNGERKTYGPPKESMREAKGFVSRKFMPKPIRAQVQEVLDEHFGDVETYMCCAHEYLDLLEGKAFYSIYSRIRPWDHLPGTLMAVEAGGTVKKWDKSSYGPKDSKGGVVVAPNDNIWEEVHSKLLARFI